MDALPLTALDFSKLSEMVFLVLSHYSILNNEDGEFLIGISTIPTQETEHPTLYYDGGAHGLLVKNSRTLVLCDYINTLIRRDLAGCGEVAVAEMPGDLPCDAAEPDDEPVITAVYKAEVVFCDGIEKLAERLALLHNINL